LIKRNAFLILIQIQNRIKKTTLLERKNILTKNRDENIGTHDNMIIKEYNLPKP